MVGLSGSIIMWKVDFMAIICLIWKEHNVCCFEGKSSLVEGKSSLVEVLVDEASFHVAYWVSILIVLGLPHIPI